MAKKDFEIRTNIKVNNQINGVDVASFKQNIETTVANKLDSNVDLSTLDNPILRQGVPVVSSGSPTYQPNFYYDSYFEYTIDQDSALLNPSGMIKGRIGKIVIKQDNIGAHALTFGTYYQFTSGSPTLNVEAKGYMIYKYSVLTENCVLMELVDSFVLKEDIYDETKVYNNTNIATEFIA